MSEESEKIQNNLVDIERREWENSHSRAITMIKEKKKKKLVKTNKCYDVKAYYKDIDRCSMFVL